MRFGEVWWGLSFEVAAYDTMGFPDAPRTNLNLVVGHGLG